MNDISFSKQDGINYKLSKEKSRYWIPKNKCNEFRYLCTRNTRCIKYGKNPNTKDNLF